MLLGREQILSYLPHREPFLFIDEIIRVDLPEGKTFESVNFYPQVVGTVIWGKFTVPADLFILGGHFPGNPVLPGVIHTEIMAQTSCFTAFTYGENAVQKKIKVALLGIDHCRIRKPVYPGAELLIKSKLVKIRNIIQIYECEVTQGNEVVSEATLMASFEVCGEEN